jgi:hypothetical protein
MDLGTLVDKKAAASHIVSSRRQPEVFSKTVREGSCQ